MGRRRSERIPVNLKATIMLADKSYEGIITNVSRDGMGFSIISVIEVQKNFVLLNKIEVKFQIPSGETIDVICELVWFLRKHLEFNKITLGMKIIQPPKRYEEFINELYQADMRGKTKEQLVTELLEAHQKIYQMETAETGIRQSLDGFLKNEDIYRALVEFAEDSIYMVDRNCKYLFLNKKHLLRLNISGEEYLGHSYGDFHSPDETMEFAKRIEEVFSTGASARYEHRSMRDGKYFFRTLSPVKDSSNDIIAVAVISKNITDHKLAEELLMTSNEELERQVKERTSELLELNEELNHEIAERKQTEILLKNASNDWRVTFDSTKDMMLMLDDKFRIIKANQAVSRFLGKSYDQIIGIDFFELFTDMDIPADKHPLERMKRTKKHEESEVYIKSRDIWILASSDPIIDNGNMTGAVHIIRDITDQKNLHLQFLQAQKMDSVGRLAGGIAHDFNNLLSGIIGYTELALLKLPAESPVRNHLMTVQEAGERAATLTQRLLAFSRKQVLQMRIVNLNRIIENMAKMLTRIIREDITLELHTQSSISNVLADPVQIEQILLNLIINARDAMPNGGKLIIETSNILLDDSLLIRHENMQPGHYVLLSVSDTGIGMSKKVQEKIFEPFFTTKAIGEGTGLGLATVYGIVTQHKGHIYVYSEAGKGSTFKIYLPASGEEAIEVSEKEQESLSGGKETVLVVDDDPSIRKLIKDILQPLGYNLFFASDGEEALKVAEISKARFDLLLTDIIMPNMNGKEMSVLFRKKYPDTKIIFMSGYTDETIEYHGVMDPDNVLIQKPISSRKLAIRLREILDKKP